MSPFLISCRTVVHFGANAHLGLVELLPRRTQAILLVKGVSTEVSEPVLTLLSNIGHHVESVVSEGEPSITSINGIWRAIRERSFDCIVACGGGSVMDTGKALRVALHKGAPLNDDDFAVDHADLGDAPLIVLPTTAGTGAEVTSNAVLAAASNTSKISLRGRALAPTIAVVDPELMRSAPKSVVLNAGLDAVVQNIEAYVSAAATPYTRALSRPVISSTLAALRAVIEEDAQAAWAHLAWGSLSSGLALANGGLGAVHGLASILGGAYPAPHGALCGRLLVPVMQANIASPLCSNDTRFDLAMCQGAISDVFAPVDPADPTSGLDAWLNFHGLQRLADWGVKGDDIDGLALAATTASSSLKNPVKLCATDLAQVLRDAL